MLRHVKFKTLTGTVLTLAMLGVAGRGAPVLADPDPSIRTRAACSVLLAVRGGR